VPIIRTGDGELLCHVQTLTKLSIDKGYCTSTLLDFGR